MCTHEPGPEMFSPNLPQSAGPKTFLFEIRHSLGTSREAVQLFANFVELLSYPLTQLSSVLLAFLHSWHAHTLALLQNLLEAAGGKLLVWADSVSQQSLRLVKRIVRLNAPLFLFPCPPLPLLAKNTFLTVTV
jgi:hypothetical protein